MSRVTVFTDGKYALVYDTDDVKNIDTPRTIVTGKDGTKSVGTSYLNITFNPGKSAQWEDAADNTTKKLVGEDKFEIVQLG